MTNALQQRILKMRLGAASAALTLEIVLGLGMVTTQSVQAQTFSVLYNFCTQTNCTDGANPTAGLVMDTTGNVYGTTGNGGTSNWGTVFKVDTSGTETVLYSFAGGTKDGAFPQAGLVRDTAGDLYGTATLGGASGYGTVFKVGVSGTETVLHSFTGGTTDGCYPSGGLLLDKAGNLYGTTSLCGSSSLGTVFKVDKRGTETVLHSFAGGATDGALPSYTSLLMDKTGNLYGVTVDGGASGGGVVYKLSSNGTETVLHSFTGGTTDGCSPFGTPAMDTKGNLYGTTEACGSFDEGIVWKVSMKGTETLLHNFAGSLRDTNDGAHPYAGVIIDAEGNLYGDTFAGGGGAESFNLVGDGTVYELNPKGKLTLLYKFSEGSGAPPSHPFGGLIRDAKGNFYGTTRDGTTSVGATGSGTVWQITK